MSTAPKKRITPEEYLALERAAEFKSQYFDGEIFAMAGASKEHVRIARNLTARTDEQLRDTPCEVFNSDMRMKISLTGLYTYPDLTIACDDLEFEDSLVDTLLNPKVIFEVLSESTEAYDRGKKFDNYRQIPSLTEYVLVSQTEPLIERFLRQPDESWRLTVYKGLDAVMQLETVPCRLKLADVYFRVNWKSESAASSKPPS